MVKINQEKLRVWICFEFERPAETLPRRSTPQWGTANSQAKCCTWCVIFLGEKLTDARAHARREAQNFFFRPQNLAKKPVFDVIGLLWEQNYQKKLFKMCPIKNSTGSAKRQAEKSPPQINPKCHLGALFGQNLSELSNFSKERKCIWFFWVWFPPPPGLDSHCRSFSAFFPFSPSSHTNLKWKVQWIPAIPRSRVHSCCFLANFAKKICGFLIIF